MLRRKLVSLSLAGLPLAGASEDYWKKVRRGANCFNRELTGAWVEAAAAARITTVRLSYEKWGGRDYLMGSADEYQQLTRAHLKTLISSLDRFAAAKIGVVVVPLSLPGARWQQMNGNRRDGRLWRDKRYWDGCAKFWRDLAGALKGHMAVVGLDVLNEPAPEVEWGLNGFWKGEHGRWHEKARGGAGDLNAFYQQMVGAIRSQDTAVPIVIESGLYGTPWALPVLEPIRDTKVLYSIHMYEPYEYTTWRKHQGKLRYPGRVGLEETGAEIEAGATWMDGFFEPVRKWMKQHSIAPQQMLVGEFGCGRKCMGAADYLRDLIDVFEREKWHWLFYSYREDNWEGMDYELGVKPPPEWYWRLSEKGGMAQRYEELYRSRRGNEIWQTIASRL